MPHESHAKPRPAAAPKRPRGAPRPPRRLRGVAVVLALGALAAAAYGIISRQADEHSLAQWTDQQAAPSVSVAPPTRSTAPRKLVLPGDVQAFYEAPIYARVSGYLQSWSQDIGAHVHAGQTL